MLEEAIKADDEGRFQCVRKPLEHGNEFPPGRGVERSTLAFPKHISMDDVIARSANSGPRAGPMGQCDECLQLREISHGKRAGE